MRKTVSFVIAALYVVLGILLLGNILLIGDKIGMATHSYVEYAFYIVIGLLLFYYLVLPLAGLLLMPEFPKLQTEDGWDVRQMKKFALSLAKNCFYISDPSDRNIRKKEIEGAVASAGDDAEALK